MKPETSTPNRPRWYRRPLKGLVVMLVMVAGCVGPGMLSLYLNNPDQGQTMTIAQFQTNRQRMAQSIRENPNIPAQARAVADHYFQQFVGGQP